MTTQEPIQPHPELWTLVSNQEGKPLIERFKDPIMAERRRGYLPGSHIIPPRRDFHAQKPD